MGVELKQDLSKETPMPTDNYVSPEFLVALIAQGNSHHHNIILAHQIPSWRIFEDVRKRIITSAEGAEIIYLQRQSIYPGIRVAKMIWEFVKSFT